MQSEFATLFSPMSAKMSHSGLISELMHLQPWSYFTFSLIFSFNYYTRKNSEEFD